MTPLQFIEKWRAANLKERSAAQEHFIDLCRLLDQKTPAEADPDGEWYCFERGASKLTGGEGWADVWMRGHFGWEYKGKRKDLQAAYVQLQQYAVALENPPLLVVCDLDRFRIHTNWTNTVQQVHELTLDDLHDAEKRELLKAVFSDPERLKPGKTRQALTEEAAEKFASLALLLRNQGHDAQTVAHFINRLVFCMFAEDVGLLPNKMFMRMLEHSLNRPDEFLNMAQDLFRAMKLGGRIGFEHVEWFNGGLFDSDEALPLGKQEVELVLRAARLDWSDVDPSILGTLFERGLDPDKRSQLGAHYTDREKIMMLVEPVIIRPLQAEWEEEKARIAALMEKSRTTKNRGTRTKAANEAGTLHHAFLERLRRVRVLDPACGSGNFLYLSILALKELEHRTNLDAEALGLGRQFPSVGPECVKGIEINPYAAELARVTVWIGEIQWMRRNGFNVGRQPILRPLETIECRDAVLNPDGTEAEWPEAEFIVGNPPFLGNKRMISVLGEDYTFRLRNAYAGRVPGGADLVTFWFEKARAGMEGGIIKRAGLVGTNSIRSRNNRKVLERIRKTAFISEAWSDEPWVVDGAAVRVSLVCFEPEPVSDLRLDGKPMLEIFSDLTGRDATQGIDLGAAKGLTANLGKAFQGPVKVGPFDIPGDLARQFLQKPLNPNGRPNSDVVKPWANGKDITRRPSDTWIIDFAEMSEAEASLYEAPFEYVRLHVKPLRDNNRDRQRRESWWRLGRSGGDLRKATSKISRFIITPRVAKYRLFVWKASHVVPDSRLVAVAHDDDTTFGILHSRFHETWSLRLGGWHGVGNDPQYTPSMGFETFPFPEGLTPNITASDYANDPRAQVIAQVAERLNELREAWLNPSDLVQRVPEVVPGYPDRVLPKDSAAATILKQRTLTNLYNERPAWLDHAHRDLDAAVAAAYGWEPDISDDEVLQRLFALNLRRSGENSVPVKARQAVTPPVPQTVSSER